MAVRMTCQACQHAWELTRASRLYANQCPRCGSFTGKPQAVKETQ